MRRNPASKHKPASPSCAQAHRRGRWLQRATAATLGAERKLKPEGVSK